jgi:hypothetical protein
VQPFRSILLGVALLTIWTMRASAQTGLEACYVPGVGAIYLIKLEGLPQACLATSHVAVNLSGAGGGDHGSLTGLADDDHLQYLLANGVRPAADGFAVTGTFGTGSIPASGNGIRLMWYPGKQAFRAGQVTGAHWDDANIGVQSMALGINTTASGGNSTAFGGGSTASGVAATALGAETLASGNSSTAMGFQTVASGQVSTALGVGTTASDAYATALGYQSTASGIASTAMGYQSEAFGTYSTVMGQGTRANPFASLVIGRSNIVSGSSTSWIPSDPLFVAGNGDATTASNALTLLKNGNLTIAGTLTQSSDIRFKEAIQPAGPALDGVLRLRPIRFRFREGTGHPTDPRIGLAAQEVERVFPELVHEDAQGHLSVAYTDLAAVLVRAVQEQQATIEALRAELAALRALLEERPRR